MQLQIALDTPLNISLSILQKVRPFIDIAEIGTPQIFQEGIRAARKYHAAFPDLDLLADLKIMDAGLFEAEIGFSAGCKYVTVLGVASDDTIRGVVQAARSFGNLVVADMIQVKNILLRSEQLLNLDVDYLCLHTAYDRQKSEKAPLASLKTLKKTFPQAKLAIAGGIGLDTIDEVADIGPEIVIVGGAITTAQDPAAMAQRLRERF
jgi:3-hexulose-6-phosphate synthase